ncbi:DUF4160 domain-containing protein [uncultured Draconibacterium sp.]|uniref:DUF4160 domain-containing protein n=1 Tax=uncultured Draconibacterium sp. TaxID=1573823 RepID=UPI002AA7D549|nr:DUF4160 domain-containing protein [uncultured Draconibacterium sp.]
MWHKQKIKYLSDSLCLHLSQATVLCIPETEYKRKKVPVLIRVIEETPFLLLLNTIKYLKAKVFGIPFIPLKFKSNPELTLDILDFRIRIEIRPKEHPPPHFHVIIDENDYSVSIKTGEFLYRNKIKKRDRLAIENWYKQNRNLIIKTWNNSRPYNCPAGKIRLTDYNHYL